MDTDVHLSKSVTISAHQWLNRPAAKSSQICTIRIDISTAFPDLAFGINLAFYPNHG